MEVNESFAGLVGQSNFEGDEWGRMSCGGERSLSRAARFSLLVKLVRQLDSRRYGGKAALLADGSVNTNHYQLLFNSSR
jgi:hypothetical protein